MTPSELKYNVEYSNHEPYYFTRRTVKFFGDTMANFGCYSDKIVDNRTEKPVDVWVLYRKHRTSKGAPCGPCSYWDKQTFKRVFKRED